MLCKSPASICVRSASQSYLHGLFHILPVLRSCDRNIHSLSRGIILHLIIKIVPAGHCLTIKSCNDIPLTDSGIKIDLPAPVCLQEY